MYKSFDLNPPKKIQKKKKKDHILFYKSKFSFLKISQQPNKAKKHKQPEITRTLYNKSKKKKNLNAHNRNVLQIQSDRVNYETVTLKNAKNKFKIK